MPIYSILILPGENDDDKSTNLTRRVQLLIQVSLDTVLTQKCDAAKCQKTNLIINIISTYFFTGDKCEIRF